MWEGGRKREGERGRRKRERGGREEGDYLRCSHEKSSTHCLKIEFTDEIVVVNWNDITNVRKSI